MTTIFERIIAREIPAKIVYEDEKVFAFLDINPTQKWHILLITKQPYPWMQEVDDETLAYIFLVAKKLMLHMKQRLNVEFINLVVEWVQVPHFHIHLIPSMIDHKNAVREHHAYDEGEMDIYQQKLLMTNE